MFNYSQSKQIDILKFYKLDFKVRNFGLIMPHFIIWYVSLATQNWKLQKENNFYKKKKSVFPTEGGKMN